MNSSGDARREPGTPGPYERASAVVWAGGWLCILALALWLSQLLTPWLVVAGAGAALWSWGASRHRDPLAMLVGAALWLALGLAAGVEYRLWEIARRWSVLQTEVEERAAGQLDAALDDLVSRGERAVAGAAGLTSRSSRLQPSAFDRLEDIRSDAGVSALAVFDSARVPRLWSGEHRGALPPSLWRPGDRYVFHQGPLFSHLYFTRPLPGGGLAVATVLLESELRSGAAAPFAERFASRSGLTPRFRSPERASCPGMWDWAVDRPILTVCFETLTQANWWGRVRDRSRAVVGIALLFAAALLALAWFRRRLPAPGAPVALVTAALLLAPLGEIIGAEKLFSPEQFVLPLPWDVTLGTLLVLLLGTAVGILVRTAGRAPRVVLPWALRSAIAAGVIAGGLQLVRVSAALGLRATEGGGGFPLQLASVLLVTLPLYLLLRAAPRQTGISRTGILLVVAGSGLAVLGALGLAALWDPATHLPWWLATLWAAPFALVAIGLPGLGPRSPAFREWLVAGAFAATAVLPAVWLLHVNAKLQSAEIELGRLGTETDPFLDFLLRNFSDRARYFDEEGEGGVDLLYHSWVASGLAREGYEARLTLWDEGEPAEELRLTGVPSLPAAVSEAVHAARGSDREVVARFTEVEGLHYLLVVPLPDDRMVSVAVPPRSRLGRATALARFLESDTDPSSADVVESVYLVPIPDSAAAARALAGDVRRDEVDWLRTQTGWRSEANAMFPSGWTHVHLSVRTSTLPLLLTRGILVWTLLVAILLGTWWCARLIRDGFPRLPEGGVVWLGTFRGRLTLALFAFFLLPTALFAAAAYQAVTREVIRSAAGVALRGLDQTVVSGERLPLTQLGAQAGMDLLLYRHGALVGAAAPEALALGLFHTWLPPRVHLPFSRGEDLEQWEIRRLGENEYVIGYRRFDAETVFAAPIPLASEEITRRQTEFRDIALLLTLLGAACSVVLSLLVGRALTRPIDELSRAAAAIGGGNLRVQLPATRRDEFGPVYRSFNRMAKRLRRARTDLVRETRRTETIVAEAATGVLALDGDACVELVNPRAEEILGATLARGEGLPRASAMLTAVADAVDEFRRTNLHELARELEVESRIVRLRIRRLNPAGGSRGAVVALEDVTSEIRTARVLAWGEMARQVAHEIKNPLTPIKLAVQHIRRAYLDGRRDFAAILERNVESILQEIDRLSEIARAFSRFGTPSATAEDLESVDVVRALEDTLTLYRGAGDEVRYHAEVDPGTPARAVARMGELKEVLVNLLEHAREAVDGGGRITVSVSPSEDEQWVEITVRDTGEGIPAELLPRIFDPHFSTRSSGTGLGLAIVRRMVESWGGEATAESEPGTGTSVRLRLRSDRATQLKEMGSGT